jgi:hypothetical protein
MRRRALQTGFLLWPIALAAALAIGPALAEDAGSGAHEDGSHLSAPSEGAQQGAGDAGGRAAKFDSHVVGGKGDDGKAAGGGGAPPGGAASSGDDYRSAPGAETANDIDTSISVQPRRRLGGRRDNVLQVKRKVRSLVRAEWLSRQQSTHRVQGNVVRNAIGVTIGRPHAAGELKGQRQGSSAFLNAAAPGATGGAGRGNEHLVKTEHHLELPSANANAPAKPLAANRGGVNGSTLTRPGAGSARIGGSAAAIAAINGTTIKPKH